MASKDFDCLVEYFLNVSSLKFSVLISQLLVLFNQFIDNALKIQEQVKLLLGKFQNIIFLCGFYIVFLEVISVIKARETQQLVLLVLVVTDLLFVRVALKSNVLFFFNLIVLRLLNIKHCPLHFNHVFIEVSGDLALGADTGNILGALILGLLDKNTCHADKVPTVHWQRKISIAAKSALTADTFLL